MRGDTYYIAVGDYPLEPNLNTAVSGTTVITIQAATVKSHGTGTGWNDAYGVLSGSQVSFSGGIEMTTGYWNWDGIIGPNFDSNSADYGFLIPKPSSCSTWWGVTLGNGTQNLDGITLTHFAFMGCGDGVDTESIGVLSGTQITSEANLYVGHSYFHGWQNAISLSNGSNVGNNPTIEYDYFTDSQSYSDHHGELIDVGWTSGLTYRFNIMTDCVGTGCIASNNCNTSHLGLDGASIYGSQFLSSNTGNGIIAAVDGGKGCVISGTAVYNNTFSSSTLNGGAILADGGGTGNTFQNNIIFNQAGTMNTGGTVSYNSYYQATAIPTQSNGQTSSANPFVNSSGQNYQLSVDTAAWTPLGSPYNIDPLGITRTSSRGMFQLGTATPGPPPAPLLTKILVQ